MSKTIENLLYPLKFQPIYKEMLWGGQALKPTGSPLDNVGEIYALSGLSSDVSIVENGPLKGQSLVELIEKFKGDFIGTHIFEKFHTNFPLLFKFIDAAKDLSVQVHPNDEVAMKKHNSFGKTEMWYVVDRAEGSTLISGLSRETSAEELNKLKAEGELVSVMNRVKTQPGDVFFIPAGRVHTIGNGNVIAEIQQTSNITYRLYDFDRKDKHGNMRELHWEDSLDAMIMDDDNSGLVDYKAKLNCSTNVVDCNYFTTNVLEVEGVVEKNYSTIDSFVVLMGVNGSITITSEAGDITLNQYETLMIPASFNNITISSEGKSKCIEVYVR